MLLNHGKEIKVRLTIVNKDFVQIKVWNIFITIRKALYLTQKHLYFVMPA